MSGLQFEDIQADLRSNVVEFDFIKQDGTRRVLKGTLHLPLIPDDQHENAKNERAKKNGETLTLWSINDRAWRAIRLDSIESAQIPANW